MIKRSLTLAGHRTSLALEAQFWEALEEMAAQNSLSMIELLSRIDAQRSTSNMSSAVRLAVLSHFRQRDSHAPTDLST